MAIQYGRLSSHFCSTLLPHMKLQNLSLQYCYNLQGYNMSFLMECESLVQLHVPGCCIDIPTFNRALTGMKRLKSLFLSDCTMIEIGKSSASAEHCTSGHAPLNVKELTALNQPRLTNLDISNTATKDDGLIYLILSQYESLQHLNISGCLHLTNASMEVLSSFCHNLLSLDISYCMKLTNDIVMYVARRMNALRHLGLNGFQLSDQQLHIAMSELPMLESLELLGAGLNGSSFNHLDPAQISAFRHLDLSGCTLSAENLLWWIPQTGALQQLSLMGCQDITDSVIESLCQHLQSTLQYLDIRWCTRLTTKSLRSIATLHALGYLDIRKCANFSDDSLLALILHMDEVMIAARARYLPKRTALSNTLQHLNITNLPLVRGTCLPHLLEYGRNLQTLQLDNASVVGLPEQMIQAHYTVIPSLVTVFLQNSKIGNKDLALFTTPYLRQLTLSRCQGLDGDCLTTMPHLAPFLEVFSLTWSPDDGVEPVMDSQLVQLSHLSLLRDLTLISLDEISMKSVGKIASTRCMRLKISNCKRISPAERSCLYASLEIIP